MKTIQLRFLAAMGGLLLLAPSALAQGTFTNTGFGLEAGIAAQEDVTTLSAEAGYVYRGRVEAGFSVARASEDQSGLDINAMGYTPFVAFYPLRQTESMPISARLAASYSFYSFSGDVIDELNELDVDLSGHAYDVGGSLFRTFSLSPRVKLIPRAGLRYVWATLEVDGPSDTGGRITEEETNGFEVLSFSTSLAFVTPRQRIFSITPELTIADGEAGFGVRTGFVLPR